MTAPCIYGLKCIHLGNGEDGDDICLYPKKNTDSLDYNDTFPLIGECDCGLMDCDSTLSLLLSAYSYMPGLREIIEEWDRLTLKISEMGFKNTQLKKGVID